MSTRRGELENRRGGALDAWSRRRAAVRAEAEAEARRAAEEKAAQQQRELAERPDDDILEELGLPDPETLERGDDFAGFMRAAVPEHLRRKALRRLWVSDPVLANLDELLDYGEDFTAAADAGGAVQTVYRVGKGLIGASDDADEAAENRTDAPPSDQRDDQPDLAAEAPRPEDAEPAGDRPQTEDEPSSQAVAPALATDAPDPLSGQISPPRRMRFSFDEAPETALPATAVVNRKEDA